MARLVPLLLLTLVSAGCAGPAAPVASREDGDEEKEEAAESAAEAAAARGGGDPLLADLLLVRLAHVRDDYPRAVSGGAVVDDEEFDEITEILEDVGGAADKLPLAPATRAALAGVSASVARHVPPAELVPAINDVVARLDTELWVEKAPPDPSRIADGAALYAAHCASCHGAHGEGPPAAVATLRPPPVPLASPSVAARMSPRRVFDTVTYGVPETAMVPRAGELSEAERWAIGFYVVQLGAAEGEPNVGASPDVFVVSAPAVAPRTLEELADSANAALAGQAPAGVPAEVAVATWRGAGTRKAADSRLRTLRADARTFAKTGGGTPIAPLAAAWEQERPAAQAKDSQAAARVDAAFAALQGGSGGAGAPTDPAAMRAAAWSLFDGLAAVERAGG